MPADSRPRPQRLTVRLASVLACLGVAAGAAANPIAFDRPDLQASTPLQVSVPNVPEGGALPAGYTADGRNLSPPVSWSEGPPRTRSFVVLMQDADRTAPEARAADPVQWLVYSIPASVLALPRGMRNVASPSNPLGSSQGRNADDSLGYAGPRLALGEPAHHYHLQVFALDRPVRLRPGAELPAVLRVMAGHVIARGELVTTYAAPAPATSRGERKGSPAPAGPGR